MVSVGYMDPGNWATDIEGGARFGYGLLWVLVLANAIAVLLQGASARLGIASGLDLAQACRRSYGRPVNVTLWLGAELAIIACDMAEVLGSAVALDLLFGVPMVLGALLTGFDVLLILALQRRGRSTLEAIIVALVFTIAACLVMELLWVRPSPGALVRGLAPRLDGAALYVAVGILGATVMPHNLYLHSALAKGAVGAAPTDKKREARSSLVTTIVALNLALFVNAAILVLAAGVFGAKGVVVTDLREAHDLLTPMLGTAAASVLFAVALLCSGQSSTITGTLAGQIVMEGFVRVKVSPVLRRSITRGIAVVPAVVVLAIAGEQGTMPLLVASQVVLSLQLPFAIVPLVRFVRARALMGELAVSRRATILHVAAAALVTTAGGALLIQLVRAVHATHPLWAFVLAGATAAAAAFLAYVALVPLGAAPLKPCKLPAPASFSGRCET